jgi:hypothetical protein
VRVQIGIPETGLNCLNELHTWLQRKAPSDYAIHPTKAGAKHCAALYLNDPALATECVRVFGLEVVGLPKESA